MVAVAALVTALGVTAPAAQAASAAPRISPGCQYIQNHPTFVALGSPRILDTFYAGESITATVTVEAVSGALYLWALTADPDNEWDLEPGDWGYGYKVESYTYARSTYGVVVPEVLRLTVPEDGLYIVDPVAATHLVDMPMTCTPAVVYGTTSYSAPVDSAPNVNDAMAGRTVPFKFAVTKNGDPDATFTSAIGKISPCASTDAAGSLDSVETYVTTASGLQNLGGGNYQFNFKTDSSWRGCKRLSVVLGNSDLETQQAIFNFR